MDLVYTEILDSLKEWFNFYRRDLPWRKDPNPYAVWISEVMLQQTQVAVVIPYFEKWMKEFPTIEHLALAPIEKVIKIWEGLGYYARARYLHEGAKYILQTHNGILPNEEKKLGKIKGLGPYTIGAILSFAYKQKKAAVDGNVLRLISRLFAVKEEIKNPKTIKKIWQIVEELLPNEESWVINEALIELGALVCKKKPSCSECPLKNFCKSFQNQLQFQIPINTKKINYIHLKRFVAIVMNDNQCLIKKGEEGKIMSDLYEFPYFDFSESLTFENYQEYIEKKFTGAKLKCTLGIEKQSFTKFRVDLYPLLFITSDLKHYDGFEWKSAHELRQLPFSSGHRRIINHLLSVI